MRLLSTPQAWSQVHTHIRDPILKLLLCAHTSSSDKHATVRGVHEGVTTRLQMYNALAEHEHLQKSLLFLIVSSEPVTCLPLETF